VHLRRWEAWSACLAAAAVPLVAAPAARAHAVLVAVVPASGAVVQRSPPQILLRFHGRIDTSSGAVELLDPSGGRHELGAIARPAADAVVVPVAGRLREGTYTVVWHLASTGSHPVEGSSSFSVGTPGGRLRAPSLLVLCAGGAATLALVLGAAAGATRRRAVLLLSAALVLGAGYAFEARPGSTRPSPTDFFTTATRLGRLGLELGVSPDAQGTNTIDLLVSDAASRPVELTGVSVTAEHARTKPLRFRTQKLAPDHFVVDIARLMRPGVWRLRIDARHGSRRLQRTISVPIRP
jgi:methionine-rich copper-binding protein CopC